VNGHRYMLIFPHPEGTWPDTRVWVAIRYTPVGTVDSVADAVVS
jgi:hypothetical protein